MFDTNMPTTLSEPSNTGTTRKVVEVLPTREHLEFGSLREGGGILRAGEVRSAREMCVEKVGVMCVGQVGVECFEGWAATFGTEIHSWISPVIRKNL